MGHISFVGKLDGDTLKAGAPPSRRGWTLDLMGKHSIDFWLTSEDLPDPNNRVTLDREGNIVLAYTPNNEAGHKRLIKKLEHLMNTQRKCPHHGHECHEGVFARNLYLGQRIPLAGVAHQNGTIRFGHDPETSALDRELQGARTRQSLRRGRQLLPFERRGESRPHDHGECAARRRSFAGTHGRQFRGPFATRRCAGGGVGFDRKMLRASF